MHLKRDTILKNGEYRIIDDIGQGGYSVTYLALQIAKNKEVVIKEFFIKECCDREDGSTNVQMGTEGSKDVVAILLDKFIKEANCIAALNHSNIVRVTDVFEENNTAYYVMEYLPAGSLASIIDRQGAMSEQDALRCIRQVSSALKYLHANCIMHLDIKPDNILINNNGEAVLIDFGLSKYYDIEGNAFTKSLISFSRGYAPKEQYHLGGVDEFCPATDIYSLGATLFTLLTGEVPIEAIVLDESDYVVKRLESYKISDSLIFAVAKAMSFHKKDRPKSVDEFLTLLEAKSAATVSRPTQLMFAKKNNPDSTPVVQPIVVNEVVSDAVNEPVNESGTEAESVVDNVQCADHTDKEAETFYLKGLNANIKEDYEEAVKWYRLAAGRGHTNAQFNLGNCHYNGYGVDKDMRLAMKWWRRAAENGHVQAQYKLGHLLHKGNGVQKNITEALKWYLKAAEHDNEEAQYMYARCCFNGEGLVQNKAEAVKWWHKAAVLGHRDAQYKLSLCYKKGEGVDVNINEAIKWCGEAVKQRHSPAERELSFMHRKASKGGTFINIFLFIFWSIFGLLSLGVGIYSTMDSEGVFGIYIFDLTLGLINLAFSIFSFVCLWYTVDWQELIEMVKSR